MIDPADERALFISFRELVNLIALGFGKSRQEAAAMLGWSLREHPEWSALQCRKWHLVLGILDGTSQAGYAFARIMAWAETGDDKPSANEASRFREDVLDFLGFLRADVSPLLEKARQARCVASMSPQPDDNPLERKRLMSGTECSTQAELAAGGDPSGDTRNGACHEQQINAQEAVQEESVQVQIEISRLLDELHSSAQQIAALTAERDALKAQILVKKTRTTALKIIGGLAMGGYGMDIHAERRDGIGEMAKDLERVGAQITEKTLREWIKEAATIIDPKTKKQA